MQLSRSSILELRLVTHGRAIHIGTKHEGSLILDWRLEREFGSRKYAHSYRTILRRSESSCAGAEVVCDEFFAHFGQACSHTVQTVVAHIKDLLSEAPQ